MFDGRNIPFPDASFEAVLFLDVLHHTEDPEAFCAKRARAARQFLVIKDHRADNRSLGDPPLHGPRGKCPPRRRAALQLLGHTTWRETFDALGMEVDVWKPHLKLYPVPVSWIFDAELHFLARLRIGRVEGKR